MSEFDPAPSSDSLERERAVRRESRDARQRVREALLSLREPTGVNAIADRADCAPNTGRKHLGDLAGLGIARVETDGTTTRYHRNESFVRWRRVNRLAEQLDDAELLDRIEAGGSVFLGPFSPVAAGDYAAGPNHVLPTGGLAKTTGGLSVDHFPVSQTVQRLDRDALADISETVTTLAETEGLEAHAESVRKRFEE